MIRAMRERHLQYLACPKCRADLTLEASASSEGDHVQSGTLTCSGCAAEFPIVDCIPRFVPPENYAGNFGYQWNRYVETQYDSHMGHPVTANRFFDSTRWPRDMSGELILEAGCGAGRHTEVVLETGATLVSFDLSNGVEANFRKHGSNPNWLALQANIFEPPVKPGIFDRVYCLAVIQHTPDPEKAFRALTPLAKPGGHIAIDAYRKKGVGKWLTSYRRFRWFTRYMDVDTVHSITKAYVDAVWPTTKWLWSHGRGGHRWARNVFLMKDRLTRDGYQASDEVQKEWQVLHLIDQLSAYHDKPQTTASLTRWFEHENIQDTVIEPGTNGLVARGTAPRNGPHTP